MLISSALPARHRKHELAQALRAGQLSYGRNLPRRGGALLKKLQLLEWDVYGVGAGAGQ